MKTWSEMTARERDALVAERVMGTSVVWVKALHAYEPREGSTALNDMVPEYVSIPCEDMGEGAVLYWTAECGTPNEYVPEEIPRYTTSIASAWEVVEKMEVEGWGWTADRRSAAGERFQYPWRFHQGAEIHRADESAVPEAICLAALRAVGVDI